MENSIGIKMIDGIVYNEFAYVVGKIITDKKQVEDAVSKILNKHE